MPRLALVVPFGTPSPLIADARSADRAGTGLAMGHRAVGGVDEVAPGHELLKSGQRGHEVSGQLPAVGLPWVQDFVAVLRETAARQNVAIAEDVHGPAFLHERAQRAGRDVHVPDAVARLDGLADRVDLWAKPTD